MIGESIAHYAIRRKLGSGGMGDVYLAEDQKLRRPVALKILPPQFAIDGQRKQRFMQEAHAASILAHPHISVIHEIGETPSGLLFISMEYLDGMTLADKLGCTSPLAVREVVDVAAQIADALDAAHAKGVTHRDLKPANIMVAARGHVKVLDFGLAKLVRRSDAVDQDESTGLLSTPGTIMGTVPYMSPEQALGHEVDHRSDIFSLGSVMYEMATGRLPFAGTTAAERITNIARSEPARPSSINPAIPAALERVILRCMEKEASRRFQTARDVQAELESIKASMSVERPPDRRTLRERHPRGWRAKLTAALARVHEKGLVHRDLSLDRIYVTTGNDVTFSDADLRKVESASDVAQNVAALGAILGDSRPPYATIAAVAMVAAIAASVATWAAASRRVTPAPPPMQRQFTQLTFSNGVDTLPSVAADGQSFVYVSNTGSKADIFVQRVGGTKAINLTADVPADNTHPAFSPDGQQIAFRSERDGGGIFVMGATGENARRLTAFGYDPAWSPDGKFVAVSGEAIVDPSARRSLTRGLWIIDAATGAAHTIHLNDAVQPSWSPHGNRIAYWSNMKGNRVICTIGSDGKDERVLLNDGRLNWTPIWSPDGRFLYYSTDRGGAMNIWRIGIDEATGRQASAPEALTISTEWSASPSIARDGRTLIFAVSRGDWSQYYVTFDPKKLAITSAPQPVLKSARRYLGAEESPDGKSIVFTTLGEENAFVASRDGTEIRQLTIDGSPRCRGATWSPDSSRIAYYSALSGDYDIWTIRADGSEPQQITRNARLIGPVWSPDGKRIAAYSIDNRRMAVFDAKPGAAVQWIPEKDGLAFWPSAWLNDHTLATTVVRHGIADGVATYDLTANQGKILSDHGFTPRVVGPDTVVSEDINGHLLATNLVTGATRDVGLIAFLAPIPRVTVSATHDRLYYVSSATQANIWMVRLQN